MIGQGEKVAGPLQPRPVQAPALPRRLVVKLLHELSGVEMRPPLTLIVDPLPVREQGTAVDVELRNASEGQEVDDGRRHDV